MEQHLCTLDICGLDVHVYLTDDASILLPSAEEAKEMNIDEDAKSFGRYLVGHCKIWLDISMCAEMLRPRLFHEMYEFILGYFAVRYDGENDHEAFMRMGYLLWGACRRNKEMLFGEGIEEALERIRDENSNG